MKRLRVLMSRQEIHPERLAGATAVVVDVFMATTTLLTILENGARNVFPVGSLEEADALGEELDASRLLRGGEQDAQRIEGYDLGPFPEEYPPERVAGKDVVFVTTNGTRALSDVASAERVLVGCLRNVPALARHLEAMGTDSIYVVCAGSGGRFTTEDFLGASTILSRLSPEEWRLNDGAWMALDFAQHHRGGEMGVLKESRAARWFFDNDRVGTLEYAGEVGASGLVAEVEGGRLHSVPEPGGYPREGR